MKRYFIAFIAACVAIVSCQSDPFQEPVLRPDEDQQENGGNVQDPEPEVPEIMDAREVTIEAGILTKTVLNGNSVYWEGGDKIALLFRHSTDANEFHVNKTFVNQEQDPTVNTAKATFKGMLANKVTTENGYNDLGFAVYPQSAVDDATGNFVFNLPSNQVADADGSFGSEMNLSSSALALSEMGDNKTTKSDFRNALSLLKVSLSQDIESVTLTGTALAGVVPLKMYYNSEDEKDTDNGRLKVDPEGDFSNAVNSVTLTPPQDSDFDEQKYCILVWPGEQDGLTITVDFKELGEYVKSAKNKITFAPAKSYNLNFQNTEDLVVTEISNKIDEIEGKIPSDSDLEDLEDDVKALLAQVQSISLMTEYLDNAVYARYAQMTYSKQKVDLSLDYIVKPEDAAEALVEAFNQNPAVVSGLLGYGKGAGLEMTSTPLAVKGLAINNLPGIGKVVTATIDASSIDNKFYDGEWDASVALQVVSGETDVMSDFANLIAKAGSVITGNNLIPIVPGARVVIPFNYAVSGDDVPYTLTVTDSQGVAGTNVNYHDNSKTGNLSVSFADGAVGSPSVTLTLTVGEGENLEVVEYDYTFVDNGDRIDISTNGDVDYIGGDAVVEVESTLGSGSLVQTGGTGVAFDNVKVFTFGENADYQQRTANVQYSVIVNSLTYYKDITLTQKAAGTPLSRNYFIGSGKNVKKLQSATNVNIQNHLNIVILGDGYVQKDYAEGGLFERRATSAMENFFGIEPYKSYRDRFDVFMAGYIYDRSQDQGQTPPAGGFVYEGTDNTATGLDVHTYFNSYWDGSGTAVSLTNEGKDKVINAVQNDLNLTGGAYYRTVVIMLINSDANAGSTFYPEQTTGSLSGDGYHSFSVACVCANSTGFGGLVKHEAGGHAFGRLADEYITVAAGTTVSADNKKNLANAHNVGFYTNVTTDYNNYSHWKMFTDAGYSSEEVGYYEGAWRGSYGVWRSSQTSIMQSTGNTGNFNAVSRYAIWRRIILQAKGIENDTMADFVSYDQKNRNK